MTAADWWGVAWCVSGIPFALVCTAQGRRDEGTWAWAIAGLSIAFMFGPFSLLMIVRNRDESRHPLAEEATT